MKTAGIQVYTHASPLLLFLRVVFLFLVSSLCRLRGIWYVPLFPWVLEMTVSTEERPRRTSRRCFLFLSSSSRVNERKDSSSLSGPFFSFTHTPSLCLFRQPLVFFLSVCPSFPDASPATSLDAQKSRAVPPCAFQVGADSCQCHLRAYDSVSVCTPTAPRRARARTRVCISRGVACMCLHTCGMYELTAAYVNTLQGRRTISFQFRPTRKFCRTGLFFRLSSTVKRYRRYSSFLLFNRGVGLLSSSSSVRHAQLYIHSDARASSCFLSGWFCVFGRTLFLIFWTIQGSMRCTHECRVSKKELTGRLVMTTSLSRYAG